MNLNSKAYIIASFFLWGISFVLITFMVLSSGNVQDFETIPVDNKLIETTQNFNITGDEFINVKQEGEDYKIIYNPKCNNDGDILKWDNASRSWICSQDIDNQELLFNSNTSILSLNNGGMVDLSSLKTNSNKISLNTGNGLKGGPIINSGTIEIDAPICSSGEVLSWDGSQFTCVMDQISTIIGAIADAEYLTLSNDSNLTNERRLFIGNGLVALDGGSNGIFSISRVAGNNIGDLEYWNGTNWQILPIGNSGDYLNVSGGIPTWTNLSSNFIENQNTIAQSANFWINGTARIDTSVNLPFLNANRLVVTDGSSNLVDSINEANLESSITGVTNIFTNNDVIPSSNIVDSFLLNTGDTATGDYNFSSGTFFIDSVNNRVGVGDITPDATLDVAGTLRIDAGIIDNSGDIGLAGQILSSTGTGIDWVNISSVPLGSIDQHTDVDTTTNAPLNNQLLGWDGSNWIPMSISSLETITNISNQISGHKIADYTNENGIIQNINESITTLSLNVNSLDYLDENGVVTNIDLSGYLDNTDSQALSFNSATNVLSLTNGGTVDLTSLNDEYSAGAGLNLNGTNQFLINSPTCAGTDKLQWNGTHFVCTTDVDTTYTAGTGLTLVGSTFNLEDTSVLAGSYGDATQTATFIVDQQGRLTFAGQVTITPNWSSIQNRPAGLDDGDDNTTYSAGTGLSLSGATFNLNANINDLLDVDTSTNTPNSGDLLSWNGTNWIPINSTPYNSNIYNSNGTLTGLRIIDLNGNDLSFDGSGSIGIGTTSPSTKFQVVGQTRSSSFSSANGTQGSPAYRFYNDNDTGLFLAGTNEIGFTTGGSSRLIVTSNSIELTPYGTNSGETLNIRFFELTSNGSNYVGFKAPDSIVSNIVWTLPNIDGTNNQVLKTDGSGNLDWVDASLLGYWAKFGNNLSPAVSGDDILLNSGENLTISDLNQGSILFAEAGGIISQNNSNLYWDNTNSRLGVRTNSPAYALDINGSGQFNGSIIMGGLTLNDAYIRDSAQINMQAGGDIDDYIYFDTTSNISGMFFKNSSLNYSNDPGIRLNNTTGEIEYRDEDESTWTSLDSLSSGSNGNAPIAIAMGTMTRGNSWWYHSTYTFDLTDVYDPDNIIDDTNERVIVPAGASYMVIYLTAQTDGRPQRGFSLCFTLDSDACNYANNPNPPGVYTVSADTLVGSSGGLGGPSIMPANMAGITVPVSPTQSWWFRVNSWMDSSANNNYYDINGWFKLEFY